MVDTTNIKSNFVKGLEENNNRILTYVTIFFTFAFLGCLIAFWIYEHRSSRCVFGPACCHTDLVNTAVGKPVAEVTLLQSGTSTNWGSGETFPEIVTFETNDPTTSNIYSFQSDLYTGNLTAGTNFPNKSTSNSGYHLNTHGVSIYFGDYYTQNWSESHVLVNAGLSAFIGSAHFNQSAFAQVRNIDAKPGGIIYFASSSTINQGYNTVQTTFKQNTSFFSNFQNTTTESSLIPTLIVTNKSSDSMTYNPFMDFLRTKNMVKSSNGCCSATGLTDCRCIDPSSRNLPSCRAPYVKGQGYGILDQFNKIAGYSQNCSHSYFKGNTKDSAADSSAAGNNVEELIPQNTTQGQNLSKSNNGKPWSPTNASGVTINLAGKPFSAVEGKNPGTGSISNAFVAENLFCAKRGDPTRPARVPMYKPEGDGLKPQSQKVGDGIRNSNLPYAKKLPNGSYQLGFK